MFDTIVRFISGGSGSCWCNRVVALAGFMTGPSVTAVKTRQTFQSGFGAVRGSGERAGLSTGRAGVWVYVHRLPLRVSAVAVAVLIFIFWTNPTGLVVLLIAIILAVLLDAFETVVAAQHHSRWALAAGRLRYRRHHG